MSSCKIFLFVFLQHGEAKKQKKRHFSSNDERMALALSYWKSEDGAALVPCKEASLSKDELLVKCRALRESGILGKARFLLKADPLNLLRELAWPQTFTTNTSHYFICVAVHAAENMDDVIWKSPQGTVSLQNESLFWDEKVICDECFMLGHLVVRTKCKQHQKKRKFEEKEEQILPDLKKKSLRCEYEGCNYQTNQRGHLNVHTRSHTNEKTYVCDFADCSYASVTNGALKSHKKIHFVIKEFVCDFPDCKYACNNSSNLITHKLVHTGVKPFNCDFEGCEYACRTSTHLTTHKRKHSKTKPYVCNHTGCLYACTTSSSLAVHKRTHMEERPFVCQFDECSYSCKSSSRLAVHNRIHSGLKPFICEFPGCDYKTAQSGHLDLHKNQHTRNKPFVCNEEGCGYKTMQNSHLTEHKLTHTLDKPFSCDFPNCEYACITSAKLKNHKKRMHCTKRDFVCEHCPRAFVTNGERNNHTKTHERQRNYLFVCQMQDGGTQLFENGNGLLCTVRCRTIRHLDYHIQRNHTLEGIGKKLESETKLARFFESIGIAYDRDWVNKLNFKGCENMQGTASYARPDFFLPIESARLCAIVLVGNDEFCHRRYPCDFQRTWNIVQSLQQTKEFKDAIIIYIRFNPNFYCKGKTFYDPPLATGHKAIMIALQNIDKTKLKPGLNMIYINYDLDEQGNLEVFKQEENDFATVLKDCVFAVN